MQRNVTFRSDRGFTLAELIVVFWMLFLCSFFFRGFLVPDRVGMSAAENVGFTDVRLMDAKHALVGFRGCDAHDAAGFELSAKSALEKPAHIIVCCGWPFKGCTVRTP